jgi:hypothetical protein
MLVLLLVIGIFLHSSFSKKEQKSIVELTGNVSGLKLDVRTLSKEKRKKYKKQKTRSLECKFFRIAEETKI